MRASASPCDFPEAFIVFVTEGCGADTLRKMGVLVRVAGTPGERWRVKSQRKSCTHKVETRSRREIVAETSSVGVWLQGDTPKILHA